MSITCTWTQDDDGSDTWHTGCGHMFTLTDDTPEGNGFKFCCFCGKGLEESPWEEPEDEYEDEDEDEEE